MSENKKTDERVELFIPRGSEREDPNVVIGINGVNYLLPRGKKSLVLPEVKAEYERAERARDRLDETKTELVEQTKQGKQ